MRLAALPDRPHVGRHVAFGLPIAMWMMLGNAFVMNVGFFMLIPLVSVHYTTALGFTAASVGLALAVRQFTQQGMMLATGSLAERVGYRPVLIGGMLVRSAGFALFTVADTLPLLIGASLVAAAGGALFEVSCRSLVAVLVPPERRADGFSLWALTSNVGLAVGPALGALLIRVGFEVVCVAAASVYIAGALGTRVLVPQIGGASGIRAPNLGRTARLVTRDRSFVALTAIMAGYYMLGTQMFITVPLQAERLTGSTDSLGLIYLVNSVVAVALQFPLLRLVARRTSRIVTMAFGALLVGVALTVVGMADGVAVVCVGVAVVAMGKVLVEPTLNVTISAAAARGGEGLLASYFGFSALSVAVGGAAGQLLGGWLFDQSERLDLPLLPFVSMGALSVVVTTLLLVFARSDAGYAINTD